MKAQHEMVCGPSGGGKTTYLREKHARHDGPSVFLTTKRNERTTASNPPRRVRQSSAAYPGDVEKTREWARKRDELVQVIVDEVQNAPSFNDGEGPLKDGLHEDRSAGVKWVVSTQNPQDLRTTENNYGPIQQCEYWTFVGKAKTWHVPFFRANGMSGMEDHLPTENYQYVVVDPAASLTNRERVVYQGETNPQFG